MPSNKAWKTLTSALSRIVAFIVALIAYVDNRSLLVQIIGPYFLGFFEGICSLVIFLVLVLKYGDAFSELIDGLRETGRAYQKKQGKGPKQKGRQPTKTKIKT